MKEGYQRYGGQNHRRREHQRMLGPEILERERESW
jgi:hypothetical protein